MNTRVVGGTPLENSENNSRSPAIVVPAAAAAAVQAESPALATSSEMKAARRGPGAPKGNRNAVRHGLYAAEGRARKAEVEALIAQAKAYIKRVDRIVAKRKARAANPRKIRLVPGAIQTRSGQLIFVRRTAGTESRRSDAPAGFRAADSGGSRKGEMP